MAIFAYSATIDGKLQRGEVEAPALTEARVLVALRFRDTDALIRRVFEPPPRHGMRQPEQRSAKPRLNHRFGLYEPTVRKEHAKPVHR